jgi:cyclopropane fatty-acyl-phospholipid synthase-like methyltransferase
MKPIDVQGFEDKFADDPDPWKTWSGRDEVLKRKAILHALPSGKTGRMLELGAGNGSNSRALAQRSLRLEATDATREGTRLIEETLAPFAPRATAYQLIVPARPRSTAYDTIVVAELLYYLSARDMGTLARQVADCLQPGGTLVLAHHRISFYDFVQHAEGIHDRFLAATQVGWRSRTVRRTGNWIVQSCSRAAMT